MRYSDINESWWDDWYKDRKIVGRLKPIRLSGSWRAEGPRNYTYPVENVVDHHVGNSQEEVVKAINTLRASLGMPPKAFPPIDTSPRIKTTPKTLLHGTSFDNALSIRRTGLEPQVGRFVATAHDNAAPLIYASTAKEFHRVVAAAYVASHHPETNDEFFDRAAILVVPNDGKWYYASGSRDDPSGTEGGDYYRHEPIHPLKIIAGNDLKKFFARLGSMPSDYVSFIEG